MAQRIGFRWLRSPADISRSVGLNPNTFKFAAQDWHRLYNDFVPMRTGALASMVRYDVIGSTGIVTHLVPYARRMYHGAGLKFSKNVHRLACAYWDKVAQAAGKKDTLIRDVKMYMRRGR